MRLHLASLLVVLGVGCTQDNPLFGGDDGDDPPPGKEDSDQPAHGFRINSPEIEIAPGEEVTKCFFFRTPNTEEVAVHRWQSQLAPGSHHLIMYLSETDAGEVGSVSDEECGFGVSGGRTSWTYAAQTAEAELVLPDDDGTARALAQVIPPNSAGFFQMHYVNSTDAPIQAQVSVTAEGLAPGTAFTRTAAFVTYNATIDVAAGQQNVVETRACSVPDDARFWMMSTHSHARSKRTEVRDGTRVMFASTDWEHPDSARFMEPATFFNFESKKLTYECEFDSDGPAYQSGPSAVLDEMCMASGYYFPADAPLFCIDNGPVR